MKRDTGPDKIDMLDIDELIIMKRRKTYLDKHPYAIWQSKDGRYWYTTLPDPTKERGVRQIRRNTQKELEDAIIVYWQEHDECKTVEEAFKEWNEHRLRTKQIIESTYIRLQTYFNSFYQEIIDNNIYKMQPIDWVDYLENVIANNDIPRSSFSHVKSIAIGIVKWSFKRGYIKYTSGAITDLLEISPNAFRTINKSDDEEVYNEEETPILMKYLKDNPTYINLGILLIFVTGIRVGELIALRHGDFSDNIVKIRRTCTWAMNQNGLPSCGIKDKPKTMAGIRNVIVPDEYRWLLDYFAEGDSEDYLFKNRYGLPIRYDIIYNALRKACRVLGIPYRSPHKIRKTYISILLDNHVNTRTILEQSGHAHISTSETIYHKNRQSESKKSEIINSIPEFKD